MNARDMRMAWYVPGTQPGCKPCSVIFKMSIVVIVRSLGGKTRQTSRIRRGSENLVILGHTSKLPKIIDRRNVQVYTYIYMYIFPKRVRLTLCLIPWNILDDLWLGFLLLAW